MQEGCARWAVTSFEYIEYFPFRVTRSTLEYPKLMLIESRPASRKSFSVPKSGRSPGVAKDQAVDEMKSDTRRIKQDEAGRTRSLKLIGAEGDGLPLLVTAQPSSPRKG